jgi:hypothetical protein
MMPGMQICRPDLFRSIKDSGSNHKSAAAETAAVARTLLNRHKPSLLGAEMIMEGHKFQTGTGERDEAYIRD